MTTISNDQSTVSLYKHDLRNRHSTQQYLIVETETVSETLDTSCGVVLARFVCDLIFHPKD
jgi:hypothetical protein